MKNRRSKLVELYLQYELHRGKKFQLATRIESKQLDPSRLTTVKLVSERKSKISLNEIEI